MVPGASPSLLQGHSANVSVEFKKGRPRLNTNLIEGAPPPDIVERCEFLEPLSNSTVSDYHWLIASIQEPGHGLIHKMQQYIASVVKFSWGFNSKVTWIELVTDEYVSTIFDWPETSKLQCNSLLWRFTVKVTDWEAVVKPQICAWVHYWFFPYGWTTSKFSAKFIWKSYLFYLCCLLEGNYAMCANQHIGQTQVHNIILLVEKYW